MLCCVGRTGQRQLQPSTPCRSGRPARSARTSWHRLSAFNWPTRPSRNTRASGTTGTPRTTGCCVVTFPIFQGAGLFITAVFRERKENVASRARRATRACLAVLERPPPTTSGRRRSLWGHPDQLARTERTARKAKRYLF